MASLPTAYTQALLSNLFIADDISRVFRRITADLRSKLPRSALVHCESLTRRPGDGDIVLVPQASGALTRCETLPPTDMRPTSASVMQLPAAVSGGLASYHAALSAAAGGSMSMRALGMVSGLD